MSCPDWFGKLDPLPFRSSGHGGLQFCSPIFTVVTGLHRDIAHPTVLIRVLTWQQFQSIQCHVALECDRDVMGIRSDATGPCRVPHRCAITVDELPDFVSRFFATCFEGSPEALKIGPWSKERSDARQVDRRFRRKLVTLHVVQQATAHLACDNPLIQVVGEIHTADHQTAAGDLHFDQKPQAPVLEPRVDRLHDRPQLRGQVVQHHGARPGSAPTTASSCGIPWETRKRRVLQDRRGSRACEAPGRVSTPCSRRCSRIRWPTSLLHRRAGIDQQQNLAACFQRSHGLLVQVSRRSAPPRSPAAFDGIGIHPDVPVVLDRRTFDRSRPVAVAGRHRRHPAEHRSRRPNVSCRSAADLVRQTFRRGRCRLSSPPSLQCDDAFDEVVAAEVAISMSADKRVPTGETFAVGNPGQRDRRLAEAAELVGRDVRLRVPERIEHADQRGPLAGKVVKVEQLKTAEAGRAQRGFDLLLVTERLQLAGGHQEIAGLVTHVVCLRADRGRPRSSLPSTRRGTWESRRNSDRHTTGRSRG